MKNGKPGFYVTGLLLLLAAATLTLYPAFRSNAQTSKPKSPAQKQAKPPAANAPAKHSGGKMGSVDQADIDKAMQDLEKGMKEFSEKDWPQVQVEIERSLKEIDPVKIQREVQASLQEVDMKSIQEEVQKAMVEVQKAMKEIDFAKMQDEIKASVKSIDTKQIEKEIAQAKKINSEELARDMAKLKDEMSRMKVDMKVQMEQAGEQMKLAKKQLALVHEGLDELEKDGLKKKDEKVNIEFKDGIMYLNDKPQSKEISDKYRKYFGKGDMHFDANDDHDNDNENSDVIKK